jgi:REP element-mobilizing transposase RayT
MPGQSLIDTSGTLHHIIARGIKRRRIFNDDQDRDNFLERLGMTLEQTRTLCSAWTLIPNHFHLLLRTAYRGQSNNTWQRCKHLLSMRYYRLSGNAIS